MSIILHLSLCWLAIVSTEHDKAKELYAGCLNQEPRAKVEKNHYFHSLNMPIYLFFYFIALVIAINPAWPTFYDGNIPKPGKHPNRKTGL